MVLKTPRQLSFHCPFSVARPIIRGSQPRDVGSNPAGGIMTNWTEEELSERLRQIEILATQTGLYQAAASVPQQGPLGSVSDLIRDLAESDYTLPESGDELQEYKRRILSEK